MTSFLAHCFCHSCSCQLFSVSLSAYFEPSFNLPDPVEKKIVVLYICESSTTLKKILFCQPIETLITFLTESVVLQNEKTLDKEWKLSNQISSAHSRSGRLPGCKMVCSSGSSIVLKYGIAIIKLEVIDTLPAEVNRNNISATLWLFHQ